jgi:peptide/nickel transport system substrate-binding protein
MAQERHEGRRVSRRWFLGAAGAVGAAGLASSCGFGGGGGDDPPATTGDDDDTTEPTQPGVTTTPPKGLQTGGNLRYTAFAQGDTLFDPHKTQASPFYGFQSMLFSRLLTYENQAEGEGTIYADLAESMPETPDGQTLVFKLNQAARWQEREPVNGRQVTANDVKFSIERQRDGDASFIRKAKWQNVESIEVEDDFTLRIRLKAPQAALFHLFADVNSFIVPPELTENAREISVLDQVGSGPFRFVEWNEGVFASASRNANWHGGNERPYLDGVTIVQPRDAATVEAGLRTKQLDVAFVGRPTADRLKEVIPSLTERSLGSSLFYGMRFRTTQFPFTDVRFRRALSLAINQRAMVEEFFAGSGDINPWISWPVKQWALPQSDLASIPGYRPGDGGRAADVADAKALLAAFAGENTVPAELPLFVLDEAETSLGMGSLMARQIQEALGIKVSVYPMPIGTLITRLINGESPWAAAPDTGWIDLDDWVYPYFHSLGTKNTFPLRDPDMDALIDAQRVELDGEARRQIGFDIQKKLLELNVGVNFVSERVIALARSYVRNFPLDISDGYQHQFADCWLDAGDEDFRGR